MLRNQALLIQLKSILLTTYQWNIRYDLYTYIVDSIIIIVINQFDLLKVLGYTYNSRYMTLL